MFDTLDLLLVEPFDPFVPLWLENFSFELVFGLLINRTILDAIEGGLLQVTDCQSPCHLSIDIVESNTFITKEAGVVGVNTELNTSGHQVVNWVSSEILSVTQHHVAQRTGFNTDILFNAQLLEVWEKLKLEAVANSLCSKQDGILDVSHISRMSLSTMEEAWHILTVDLIWLLMLKNLLSK